MKLRILDNSIRLRLTRTEVDKAARDGAVRGAVSFPDGSVFKYVFESSPAIVSSSASFSGNQLVVKMPRSEVLSWAATEQVSLAARQVLDDRQVLDILVEKDFACLAPRPDEDESDMFPHPGAGKDSC